MHPGPDSQAIGRRVKHESLVRGALIVGLAVMLAAGLADPDGAGADGRVAVVAWFVGRFEVVSLVAVVGREFIVHRTRPPSREESSVVIAYSGSILPSISAWITRDRPDSLTP